MYAQNNLVRCRLLGHFAFPQASVSKRGLVQKMFCYSYSDKTQNIKLIFTRKVLLLASI